MAATLVDADTSPVLGVVDGRGSAGVGAWLRARSHAWQMSGSMGRVRAAGDNAAMESFFALLQKNVLDRRHWAAAHLSRRSSSCLGSTPPAVTNVRGQNS